MIVGCGRSGNTLLRSMLVAGGEITIPPESYVLSSISRHYSFWRFKSWADICDAVCNKLSSHPEFKTWNIDLSDVLSDARSLSKEERNLLEIIRLVYIKYGQTHKQGLKRWGDKTPLNTLYLDAIARMMPNAKYIHIVRDPRAVANSYVRAAGTNENIKENTYELAAKRWLDSVEALKKFKAGKQSANVLEIRYEDLLINPKETLETICSFTALSFSERMLKHSEQDLSLGDVDNHLHHTDVKQAIDISKISAWESRVTPEDRELVERMTKNAVKPYNYF